MSFLDWIKDTRSRCLVISCALFWLLAGPTGCSVTSWDAPATEGRHSTTWNHGLEISFTGWGLYVGPGRDSTTTVENEFEATAGGTGKHHDATRVSDAR